MLRESLQAFSSIRKLTLMESNFSGTIVAKGKFDHNILFSISKKDINYHE